MKIRKGVVCFQRRIQPHAIILLFYVILFGFGSAILPLAIWIWKTFSPHGVCRSQMPFVILFLCSQVQYECGNYTGASEYLYFHRILVQPTDANYLNGMWGKLAAEILLQNWDTALEDLNRLKQFIDESTFGSSLQTLQQRTWLIHWSLFVFFNHPKVSIVDYFDLFFHFSYQ
jgi:hypothetical protein